MGINVLISEGGEVQCPNCGQMQSRLKYHLTSKNIKTMCKYRNIVHNVEDFLSQIASFKKKIYKQQNAEKVKDQDKRYKKENEKKKKEQDKKYKKENEKK